MLQGEGKRREAASKGEVDSNATAFKQKCLAALLLCRASLWAAWTAALGKHASNDLSPWGGSEQAEDVTSGEIPEQQSSFFSLADRFCKLKCQCW